MSMLESSGVDAANDISTAVFTQIDAVLFDLDGTLLHTAPDLSHALNAAFERLRLPSLEQTFVEGLIGGGVEQLVRRAAEAQVVRNGIAVLEEHCFQRLHALFMRNYRQISGRYARLYPGTLECLKTLKAAGIRLGCVTNKLERFVVPLIDQFGLQSVLGVVVCGDTLAQMKPSPAPLRLACEVLRVPLARTLLVGDSVSDLRSARAAGCRMVGVSYGYNSGRPIADEGCDAVVDSLATVAASITRHRAHARS